MEDWAEVHRLFHREGRPKAAIARQLAMSRNTVERLLQLTEPPRYVRPPKGSLVDPFAGTIAALLAADPTVPATVICERLRSDGYRGGTTILRDHLATVRPGFLAARSSGPRRARSARSTGGTRAAQVPVGRGRTRPAFGLVATLPHSGAHAAMFSFTMTVGDVRPGLLGCLARLGGVPEALVFDNDASIVASRAGDRARLHDEVAWLLGALRTKAVVLRPRRPPCKAYATDCTSWAVSGVEP